MRAGGSVTPTSTRDGFVRDGPRTHRAVAYSVCMAIYRIHDTTGEDLGVLEHPAPNLESGDVVVLTDGREGLVTAGVEAEPDNTMRAYPEIAASWAEASITPEKWVAFYCGTGWRASETWLYALLMGWPRAAVYDGGWFEWSKDPERNPIEVGLAPAEVAA